MSRFVLYSIGVVLAVLWARSHRRPRLGHLLGLWGIGVLVARIGPVVSEAIVSALDPADSLDSYRIAALLGWTGSVVLLRALLGLTAWEERWDRKRRIFFLLFALSLVIAGLTSTPWEVILAGPWLWSHRWRERLGATSLALLSLASIVFFLLCLVSFGPADAPETTTLLVGFDRFASEVTLLAALYALLAFPRLASRIHLSIRRIRNRLVVSHLLAGVVPMALVVVFLLLVGASFLATYRGVTGERLLREMSERAEEAMRAELIRGDSLSAQPFGPETAGQIVLVRAAGDSVSVRGGTLPFPADSLLQAETSTREAPLLWSEQSLFLRARAEAVRSGRTVRAEALAPLGSFQLDRISRVVGMAVKVNPSVVVERSRAGFSIGPADEEGNEPANGADERANGVDEGTNGTDERTNGADERAKGADEGTDEPDEQADESRELGPTSGRSAPVPGGTAVGCLQWTDSGWRTTLIPVYSSSALGEPLGGLISTAGTNPVAAVILVLLGLIAALLGMVIWITVSVVLAMGRSITRSVHVLNEATTALGAGKLEHRIQVEGQDDLWRVASSFNQMAEGLARVREMELENQKLEEELRLARTIQQRLFPAAPPQVEHLELAGRSLPARHVGGDYFDYLTLPGGCLGLVVADVSGKGAPAALLMSSFRASLRSHDLGQLGPAETMGRLNRFVHSSVDPGKFITAFLAVVDPSTGELRYASAGHDAALLLRPDGEVEELTEGGLVLGILPEVSYSESRVQLPSRGLLAVFTDGVTEAQNPGGDFYGTERLLARIREGRDETCARILDQVVAQLQTFAESAPQFDDITLVLARRV